MGEGWKGSDRVDTTPTLPSDPDTLRGSCRPPTRPGTHHRSPLDDLVRSIRVNQRRQRLFLTYDSPVSVVALSPGWVRGAYGPSWISGRDQTYSSVQPVPVPLFLPLLRRTPHSPMRGPLWTTLYPAVPVGRGGLGDRRGGDREEDIPGPSLR